MQPKDAAELHKTELESFLDPNPEAATFYRMREKVRQIVRVREENEAYHRVRIIVVWWGGCFPGQRSTIWRSNN